MNSFFGTDGIRAHVGHEPLHEDTLPMLAKAIAQWIFDTHGPQAHIVMGCDTRNSGAFIQAHLQAALLRFPFHVSLAGTLPTPALVYVVTKQKKYDIGIMITASHNPFYDNGIKLVTKEGKITQLDEKQIMYAYEHKKFTTVDYANLGSSCQQTDAVDDYRDALKSLFKPDFLNGLRLGIDCAHGALERLAPDLFTFFGAAITTIGCSSNGFNINNQCGSTTLTPLQRLVVENNLDCGIAFDGDGDRVMFVNSEGMIKDGDDLLAILAMHPAYAQEKMLVSTIMANEGLQTYCTRLGKEFIRTAVGDKYVAEALIQQKAQLGAEPSGHVLIHDFMPSSDGLYVALKVLETMLLTNNKNMQSFAKMAQAIKNIPIKERHPLDALPTKTIIETYKAQLKTGRIIARYSGTEPILRIMVETDDRHEAHRIADELAETLTLYFDKGIYEQNQTNRRSTL